MDTTWFAVDRDGHVGVFKSGEAGAVPRVVSTGVGPLDGEIEQAVDDLVETGEPELDVEGMVHPGLLPGVPLRRRRVAIPRKGQTVFFITRDPDAVAPLVRVLGGRVRAHGATTVVEVEGEVNGSSHPRAPVWLETMNAVQKHPSPVKGCSLDSELQHARHGLFVYAAHDERYNIPEPYGREFVPARPLRVEQLPPRLADRLSRTQRLDVSFREDRYVQPAELMICDAWGCGVYLARDGYTVRPLPGSERPYEDEAVVLELDEDEIWHPVVFDPPVET